MTLTETTHYISEKESCEVQLASQQLFLAIVDGKVTAKRGWVYPNFTLGRISPSEFRKALKICLKGDGYVKIDSDSQKVAIDPDRKKWIPNITIVGASDLFSDDDMARDDMAGEDPFDYDPLWLRRKDVMKLWEPRSAESRNQRNPPASLKEIESEAKKIYKKGSPNVDVAETLIRDRLPNARRKHIRLVLSADEFARLRSPPGRQPKR
jgi:hypothetical protein